MREKEREKDPYLFLKRMARRFKVGEESSDGMRWGREEEGRTLSVAMGGEWRRKESHQRRRRVKEKDIKTHRLHNLTKKKAPKPRIWRKANEPNRLILVSLSNFVLLSFKQSFKFEFYKWKKLALKKIYIFVIWYDSNKVCQYPVCLQILVVLIYTHTP